MVFSTLDLGKPRIKDNQLALGDISVLMGLNGVVKVGDANMQFKGMMVLSFTEKTYVNIAQAMLSQEFSSYNDEIRDVGAEIANICTGNAKKFLRQMGYAIEMSIPSTVVGQNHQIQYPLGTQVVVLPLKSTHGDFFMELCYQDMPEKSK
jgi:chemotaxis protein CheX